MILGHLEEKVNSVNVSRWFRVGHKNVHSPEGIPQFLRARVGHVDSDMQFVWLICLWKCYVAIYLPFHYYQIFINKSIKKQKNKKKRKRSLISSFFNLLKKIFNISLYFSECLLVNETYVITWRSHCFLSHCLQGCMDTVYVSVTETPKAILVTVQNNPD